MTTADALRGLLLGTAVGDAIALPMEGLGPARIARLFPGPPRHRLVAGRGMVSDDTEHALFTAQALIAHPSDVAAFRRSLAWKLRLWLLSAPAGVGFATLRAGIKLWLGFPRPGVWSAGNGPAMRAPVLGAALALDPARRRAMVEASTLLTHTDPRALTGALAMAELAAWAVRNPGRTPAWAELDGLLRALAGPEDRAWPVLLDHVAAALAAGTTVADLAGRLGSRRGVSGYMYHSVPAALFAWLRHPGDAAGALGDVIAAGGDTDSVAALVGALVGATGGEVAFPPAYITGIAEWPRSVAVLRQVGDALPAVAAGAPGTPIRYFWPGVPLRNAVFLVIVLAHGLRRLAPPYG